MDEPVPDEPVPAEPVSAEPVPAEPVSAEPVPDEPVPVEPLSAKAVPDEPAAATVRVRLDLGYDGTDFSGWAAQPGRRTVEGDNRTSYPSETDLPSPAGT